MSLKYALMENLLTAEESDFSAKTVQTNSFDLDAIIRKMIKRGSTTTESDIYAVLTEFFSVAGEVTEEGGNLNLPIFSTSFSIKGVFDGAIDGFDHSRHRIKCNVVAGKTLKEAAQKISVQKVNSTESTPHVLEVVDSISGSVNENITSGGVVTISGSLLKVAGEDAAVGVYFVAEDGTEHKVQTLVDNKPARLIAMVPQLSAGEYRLVIRTQYSGGKLLKVVKAGVFDRELSIL